MLKTIWESNMNTEFKFEDQGISFTIHTSAPVYTHQIIHAIMKQQDTFSHDMLGIWLKINCREIEYVKIYKPMLDAIEALPDSPATDWLKSLWQAWFWTKYHGCEMCDSKINPVEVAKQLKEYHKNLTGWSTYHTDLYSEIEDDHLFFYHDFVKEHIDK
jgi:hypothetical protein